LNAEGAEDAEESRGRIVEQERIKLVAERLARARSVVVMTGAGVSAESGLRTFRGGEKDMNSLWKEFDPQTLATPEAFDANPEMVSRWYDWRRLGCLAAEPNAGHLALAAMENMANGKWQMAKSEGMDRSSGRSSQQSAFTLLTQNVDRLHQRAGSINVVELHGTIMEWRCTRTGAKVVPSAEGMTEFPTRTAAGGLLRPDVVWFGEALPEEAVAAAQIAVARCDVFLSVGTSSVVYPAAGFVHAARARGAFTAEVNADETVISGMVDVSLRGKSGEVLPRVLEMMRM
jgi:NAD-dependent deacetylase